MQLTMWTFFMIKKRAIEDPPFLSLVHAILSGAFNFVASHIWHARNFFFSCIMPLEHATTLHNFSTSPIHIVFSVVWFNLYVKQMVALQEIIRVCASLMHARLISPRLNILRQLVRTNEWRLLLHYKVNKTCHRRIDNNSQTRYLPPTSSFIYI